MVRKQEKRIRKRKRSCGGCKKVEVEALERVIYSAKRSEPEVIAAVNIEREMK